MQVKPITVVIICWVIMMFAIINLALAILYVVNEQKMAAIQAQLWHVPPTDVIYLLVLAFINPIINIIAAIFMLKGRNWARWLFLFCNIVIYAITLVIAPGKISIFITLVLFLIFLIFLYSPLSNKFFKKTNSNRKKH